MVGKTHTMTLWWSKNENSQIHKNYIRDFPLSLTTGKNDGCSGSVDLVSNRVIEK